jgi:hypothetical protein
MARKYEELAEAQSSEAELNGLYELVNPVEIGLFLRLAPQLVALLKEAHLKISQFFPNSRITIERISEANEQNGDCQMAVTVFPPENMSEINAAIGELDSNWYLRAVSRIRGDFCIDYEHPSLPSVTGLFDDLVGTVEGPTDWALEHDHYLYGTPKRYGDNNHA